MKVERQRARKLELSLESERQTSMTLKDQVGRTDQRSSQAVEQLRNALDTETKHCQELHRYVIYIRGTEIIMVGTYVGTKSSLCSRLGSANLSFCHG